MTGKIKVLVVDDIADTRENLRRLLQFDSEIEVVGEAANGEEAVIFARNLLPDIILMDINMPVMDGIQATSKISLEFPQIGVIILSVQGEQEYLRKAMSAGARDYLTKPPGSDDLLRTIRQVYENEKLRLQMLTIPEEPQRKSGQIFSVFSTKGGVGKSTIAVNLAAAIAQISGKKTVIVDLDLQFGDVAMLLDLVPRRTVSDLVSEPDLLEPKTVESYLLNHPLSGLKVLPAPIRPEYAEVVHNNHIENILTVLKGNYDYVIVDTRQSFDDITLTALDQADTILVVSTLDVLTIKNVKLGLEVMASLHYESSKIKLILNRETADMGVSVKDLEESIKFPVSCSLPSDGKLVVMAANRGTPFVISDPKTPISESIFKLAHDLTGIPEAKRDKSGFGWGKLLGGK